MGVQFDHTEKSGNSGKAYYNVSAWPTLKVTQGEELAVNFTAYGVENGMRQVDVFALPKGAFPDMTQRVKLTSITTADASYSNTVKIPSRDLSSVLGKDVDIIIDDGYGRTEIQSVTLPDNLKMDFVPTKLSLTEAGQLWVKFNYNGDNVITSDYVKSGGMPMTAKVDIGGAVTTNFDLSSMDKDLPSQLKNGQEFSYLLGKIEISNNPGTYYIKADVNINNPNHPDRALESPTEAYHHNNEIQGGWTITRESAQNDLIAQSITASPSALTKGQSSTVTAKVKNVGAADVSNVLIRFIQDGNKTIYEATKTMPANTPITVGGFKWTGDVGIHTLSVHVDPEQEKPDKDRSNNLATTGCSVTSNGGDAYCDTTKPQANWDVSYPLITGYRTKTRTVTWTDAEGKSHSSTESYTDYSNPIWETRNVTYNEKLTVSAELNTKQGIPTDPDNPKDEDRESRGSWEIIPWAEEKGLDPNEVTRAGYGVEIKVKTNYTTDWETKVPKGLEGTAQPLGGELKGPTEVRVYIWDTNDDYVTSIGLVKTSGDDKSATWELPREHFESKFLDIYERKFYTDVHAPDGEYTFKIVAMHAGQNDLSSCYIKKITIYGSMYDDWQTKLDTSEWY